MSCYSNSTEGVKKRVEIFEFDGTAYRAETENTELVFPNDGCAISDELISFLRSDGDERHVWWEVQPAYDEASQADYNAPKTADRTAHPVEWGTTDYYIIDKDAKIHWLGKSGTHENELDDPHVKKFLSFVL